MKHFWISCCFFFESSLWWLHSHVYSQLISFMVSDISVVSQDMSNMLVLIQSESILYYYDLFQLFSIMSWKIFSCVWKVEGDKHFQTCSNTCRGQGDTEEWGKKDTAIRRNKKDWYRERGGKIWSVFNRQTQLACKDLHIKRLTHCKIALFI